MNGSETHDDLDLDALAEALGERVRRDESLASHTAMRVGGPADLLLVCRSVDEVVRSVRLAWRYNVPWRVLGGGCNVLIADSGVCGLVIINRAAGIAFHDETVRAEAGVRLTSLAQEATRRGLGRLVWAMGLPGTVGGAVVGNAGAFEGDIAGVLRSGTVLETDGGIVDRPAEWFELEYRGSRIKQKAGSRKQEAGSAEYVVLAATFELQPSDSERLAARAREILERRRTRYPSGATMGSTFKNPPGDHAGRLIERAGLKGHRIGGARISEQHANFLVSTDDATAADVLALIEHAQAEVERQFGVELELEIELVGW